MNKKKKIFILSISLIMIFVVAITSIILIKKDNLKTVENKKSNEKQETKEDNKIEEKVEENKNETDENSSKEKIEKESNKEKDRNEETKEEEKESTSKPAEPETNEPVLTPKEKENDILRKELEQTYGLAISYGNEPMTASRDLIRGTDENVISNQLNTLSRELSKYPTGFFNSFKQNEMPLTILLVEGVVGSNIAGAADTSYASNPKLILTNTNFSEVFHHELMHCIDLYLSVVMYRDGLDPWSEYESLNPSDFVYGNTSYQEQEAGNPHFWFDYAKTSVSEDRAELFKAMMTVESVLLKRGALQAKGTVICRQIKTYFNIYESTYFERSINVSV